MIQREGLSFDNCRPSWEQALLAIIYLGKRDDVCFDLGKPGAVQQLVNIWTHWEDDDMKQLFLRVMNELARIGEAIENGGLPVSTAFIY